MKTRNATDAVGLVPGSVLLTDRSLSYPEGTTVAAVLIHPAHGCVPDLTGSIAAIRDVLGDASEITFPLDNGIVAALPAVRPADAFEVRRILRARLLRSLPDASEAVLSVGLAFVGLLEDGLAGAASRALAEAISDGWESGARVPSGTPKGGIP